MACSRPPSTSISDLPENCISHILSLLTPGDVCRASAVSWGFRLAADSDYVWEGMLPLDLPQLLSRSASPPIAYTSKKNLFFLLCSSPLLIDSGKRRFSLERSSGKKCFMLSARELSIVWGDDDRYWKWSHLPDSRFSEVAELLRVCWLEIRGAIKTAELSPRTQYSAYLVLKHNNHSVGFYKPPAELSVCINGNVHASKREAFLHLEKCSEAAPLPMYMRALERFGSMGPHRYLTRNRPAPSDLHQRNGDGEWMEVEIGEFSTDDDGGNVEFGLMEIRGGHWKSGLVLEGIEIRPKTKSPK